MNTVPEASASLARVRELVLAYGWNSTSYQIVNPGIRYWFAEANDGVIGFVAYHGVRVVAGAPVCPLERLPEVAAEFERDAVRANESICYFAAEARLESLFSASPKHSKILLGAQPVFHPHEWIGRIVKHASLRSQVKRARNKGVTVNEWPTEKAHDNPALRRCLSEWLAVKGLPTLHFLVEPYTLARLFDRRVFVAERSAEVIGFVMLSPIRQRNGWLFEQFVHRPGAPNGTVELMIDTAMRALAEDGYEYATLGLAPLSTRAKIAPFDNPLWLRVLLAWMRVHGQRFYNFDGLDAFKAKLQPQEWEPVFALSSKPHFSPRTLYSMAAAFSGGATIRLISGGLWRAAVTEFKWFKRGLKEKLSKN